MRPQGLLAGDMRHALDHGEPGSHHASQSRLEIAGLLLDAWQARAKRAQRLQRGAIRVVVGVEGEQGFDRMIDGPDAARQP